MQHYCKCPCNWEWYTFRHIKDKEIFICIFELRPFAWISYSVWSICCHFISSFCMFTLGGTPSILLLWIDVLQDQPAGRILELSILHLAMSEITVVGTRHQIVINEARLTLHFLFIVCFSSSTIWLPLSFLTHCLFLEGCWSCKKILWGSSTTYNQRLSSNLCQESWRNC